MRHIITYIISIIGILLIILLINVINKNRSEIMTLKNNITALNDSLTITKQKNGDLLAQQHIFITDLNNLKSLNNNLYNQIKTLPKPKKIQSGAYISSSINNPLNDTVYIVRRDTVENIERDFNFSNEFRQLSGEIKYRNDSLSLNFTNDNVNFDYTIGINKDNVIYIKSSNPYVKFNEISGFTIPKPRNKKFIIGPSISYGYDIRSKKLSPSVGISLSYKIISF